tara:strand:+ start:129 stop:320 length:192 start_codon:yes stop_codon:yes gene_type:complete
VRVGNVRDRFAILVVGGRVMVYYQEGRRVRDKGGSRPNSREVLSIDKTELVDCFEFEGEMICI